jgi:hypothetical protein
MSLSDVSNILWKERHLLELLLFKLEEEQLLLAAGRTRWLAQATREVEMVLEEIKQTELARAIDVDDAAAGLGLGANPSLRELAEAAPSPWNGLLAEHRAAFLATTEEIVTLAQTNKELLARGYQAAREVLSSFGGSPERDAGTYGPPGTATKRSSGPLLLDEAL